MGLADVLQVHDELFVLASYPMPGSDWGGGGIDWEEHASHLDEGFFEWDQPWSNEACVALLSVDLDEQDASLGDVDLEYDCACVLVWSKGHWNKETLPAPCVALSRVDGQGIAAIGSNDDVYKRDAGQWKVCAPDDVPNSMIDLSVARYRGVNYEACGEDVLRLAKNFSKPVAIPAPSIADLFHTWSKEVGSVSLRVVGERLWAVGAHHLAYTNDGRRWQLLNFRKPLLPALLDA